MHRAGAWAWGRAGILAILLSQPVQAHAAPAATRPAETIHVDESREAGQLLQQAAESESKARWSEAAVQYQRILADYGKKLVATTESRFVNAADLAADRLANWPDQGRRVWAQLFSRSAQRDLDRLGPQPTPRQLLALAERWPLTPAGKQAAEVAAQALPVEETAASQPAVFNRPAEGELHGIIWSFPPQGETPLFREFAGLSLPNGPLSGAIGDTRPKGLGTLYLQDSTRMCALSAISERVRWTYSAPRAERLAADLPIISPIVSDRNLLAVFAAALKRGEQSMLVCLDIETGEPRWQLGASVIMSAEQADRAAWWRFEALEQYQESALVILSGRRSTGLVSYYVAQVDPSVNHAMWHTYIATLTASSAARVSLNRAAAAPSSRPATALDADSVEIRIDGRVLAGVSPSTGRLHWIELAARPSAVPDKTDETPVAEHTGRVRMAASDHLSYVYVSDRIAWIAGWHGGRQALEQAAADSRDCGAQLDLAYYLLSKPDLFNRGLQVLDAAISCASTQPAGADRQPRGQPDALFNAIMFVAARITTDAIGPEAHAAAADKLKSLLARARPAAITTEQQVRYRLLFAACFRRLESPGDALRLYHEILAKPDLRKVDAEIAGLRGLDAADRVAQLLRILGREVYRPYEDKAADLLGKARSRGDLKLLETVCAEFPNSQAASRALLARAELECRADRPLNAAAILEDALLLPPERRRINDDDLPAAIQLLAESFQRAGESATALSWLNRGARDYPDKKLAVGNRSLTFAELRTGQLDRIRHEEISPPAGSQPVAQSQPSSLRLQLAWTRNVSRPITVLEPLHAEPGERRLSRALLRKEGFLESVDLANGDTLWSIEPPMAVPVWLGQRVDLHLLASRYQVSAVEVDSGRIRWQHGQAPAAAALAVTDPEFLPGFSQHVLGLTRLLSIKANNSATLLRVTDGKPLWERRLEDRVVGPLAMNDAHIVYATSAGDRTSFVVLDALTGEPLRTVSRPDNRQAVWLRFTPQRTFIAAGSNWLACYDSTTGKPLWTQARAGMRIAALELGQDALYLPTHDGSMTAVELRTGWPVWHSEPVAPQSADIFDTWLSAGHLWVFSDHRIVSIGISNGRLRETTVLGANKTVDAARPAGRVTMIETRRGDGSRQLAPLDVAGGRLSAHTLPLAPDDDWAVVGCRLLIRSGDKITAWKVEPG